MKKIILFDMDGTLIDSTSAIVESFNNVFFDNSMPQVSRKEVARYIGYTLHDMFVFLGAKNEDAPRLCKEYKNYYTKICNAQTNLLPRVSDAIYEAHTFAHLGIVTTKTKDSTCAILEHFGLLKFFNVVIGRDSVEHPKPSAEPILRAIEGILGENARAGENTYEGENARAGENIFMIGDTILDLLAAQNAKINGVGVLCGYGNASDLKQYSGDIFEDAFSAVCAIKANLVPKTRI